MMASCMASLSLETRRRETTPASPLSLQNDGRNQENREDVGGDVPLASHPAAGVARDPLLGDGVELLLGGDRDRGGDFGFVQQAVALLACGPRGIAGTGRGLCRVEILDVLSHEAPLPHDEGYQTAAATLTDDQAKAAAAAIDEDLRSGRLVRTTVKWPFAFRATLRLSGRHSAKTGRRSLDILHVASARALRMKEFATFDSRQRTLAAAAGLREAV